ELQNIADSAELLRRSKGRRGLDILKSMQEGDHPVHIEVIDDDPEQVQDVDGKLIALARELDAKVITIDYNLNKVAQIEGV
ncbi:MAG: PIN/TRAM domain-containing protein, partial [Candidatus Hydrogenedentes bacterium]|nr:PIN/TRAM domain-containing protein [Candidatus Hydrogenedentota bacterium]